MLNKCSLTLTDPHFDFISDPRTVCWVFFGSSEEKKHANALGKFWHKGLNFSSHEDAPKMADQSFCVSHRPNGRHALSRKSRVIILLIVYLGEGAVAGFAKIV